MSLSITGKITKILEVESGESKAGKTWKKQNFIIDNGDTYNPNICFTLFGEDKIGLLQPLQIGDSVEVFFNLSSKEFNEKWYHNINAWKISSSSSSSTSSTPIPETPPIEEEDLPF